MVKDIKVSFGGRVGTFSRGAKVTDFFPAFGSSGDLIKASGVVGNRSVRGKARGVGEVRAVRERIGRRGKKAMFGTGKGKAVKFIIKAVGFAKEAARSKGVTVLIKASFG